MDWKQLLAYITASVDENLLIRNAYLVAENRLLRKQIPGRVPLTDVERTTLAEIGKQLGKQALAEVATMGKMTVDQVLEEAKTFSRDEQQHLRDTLDVWLRQEPREAQLERMLYEAGLLRDIRAREATAVSSPRCSPVPVRGQPVSERLIEERR
jgi:hypothetical protein